ncbi:MAG: hypothetical protein ACRC18_04360 [Cetobacterium sp.]
MIKIDTKELDKFSVYLKARSTEAENEVIKTVRDSTLKIERGAKENLTSNGSVKTGHLRRGITSNISKNEGIVHTSNIVYSMGVEKGTKPHTIKAKNGKYLYWKGARHPVKQVNHPGSKAKPYLIPAFEKEIPYFVQKLEEIIKW